MPLISHEFASADAVFDEHDFPNEDRKKPEKGSYARFKQLQRFLESLPDRHPVLLETIRDKDSSPLFSYQIIALNYADLAEQWFKDRNVTYRRKFVEYLKQLYAMLIAAEFDEDGVLMPERQGMELYSVDLKKICRNYIDFNRELGRHGFLDRLALHENRTKKKRCIRYGVPGQILAKGVRKIYLPKREKRELIKTIRVSSKPDDTAQKLDEVMQYYCRQIKRTKIPAKDFANLDIELAAFRKLYPRVVRHWRKKIDLKLGEKEGRLYSVYLNAPRAFRRILRWNGKHPMVEGDIAASHFHFLLAEMQDEHEREQMKQDLQTPDPYLTMCGNPNGVKRQDLKSSSHQFKYGARLKKYPRMHDAEWKEARRLKRTMIYREGLFFRNISKRYPKFADTMAEMRILGKNQKSKFACKIMRRESDVMVQMVGRKCMREKLVYLPIHDGFLTLPRHYDRVCEIVTESFLATTGSKPFIRRKNTPTPVKESR